MKIDYTITLLLLMAIAVLFCKGIVWKYNYTKDYPQCRTSRDVVTCVEIAKQRADR